MQKGIQKSIRIPVATYRLQFNKNFTFIDAKDVVKYLNQLGISDCYCSPYLKARSGSMHGYDIIDHEQLNPDIGTEKEYDNFVAELRRHNMGQLLDIVPNHMGASHENRLWMDALEYGPASPYAHFFDINWSPISKELKNKILLPILEDDYRAVLVTKKIRLSYELGVFKIKYYDNELPVNPQSYRYILETALQYLKLRLSSYNSYFRRFNTLFKALSRMPPIEQPSTDLLKIREEGKYLKCEFKNLCYDCAEVFSSVKQTIKRFNGVLGDINSFNKLDKLLDMQFYRLSNWRLASKKINYRRFFDINDLVGIRIEDLAVFYKSHKLIFHLLSEGKITGLRIDHPDGLLNPSEYFLRLQKNYKANLLSTLRKHLQNHQKESLAHAHSKWPLYVLAEKILMHGESLPTHWAIYGTTGYEFINDVNGLFINNKNQTNFNRIYFKFIGKKLKFNDIVYHKKKHIIRTSMMSELNTLSHLSHTISNKNNHNFQLNHLKSAIEDIVACFPVYRTYVTRQDKHVKHEERKHIRIAVNEAKKRNIELAPIFDFIGSILTLDHNEKRDKENRREMLNFILKFQQFTAPVMAKALEDTALYVFNRLVSLNEVGVNPDCFGTSIAEFHKRNTERIRKWPFTMLSTSTHDTKRSEDTRARINVLSEIPEEWNSAITRWSKINSAKKIKVNGKPAPDRNDEYLLYQTLLGVWPFTSNTLQYKDLVERIVVYMKKAIREAKTNTSWTCPNLEYENAVENFIRSIMCRPSKNIFIKDFLRLQKKVSYYGMLNSLSQLLLKLTSPGTPDIYQGNEIWDFSLVDPDNRRKIDYTKRSKIINDLKTKIEIAYAKGNLADMAKESIECMIDGQIKMYVTYLTLTYRNRNKDLFYYGDYLPLKTVGEKREHVCAFAREFGERYVIIAVPRLVTGLIKEGELPFENNVWRSTRIILTKTSKPNYYYNLFTGKKLMPNYEKKKLYLSLDDLFDGFPVALLSNIAPNAH